VFEALYDLDFIGNDDEKFDYEKIDLKARYQWLNRKNEIFNQKRRSIDGKPDEKKGLTYAEWSKKGRLNGRFINAKNPFYVKNFEELENTLTHIVAPLHNHKTSKQNDDVIKRLDVILNTGDYDSAKKELEKLDLIQKKEIIMF
jgi:DNA (cytosine-5)-methyltransferase 1